jgi:hypothetical protein
MEPALERDLYSAAAESRKGRSKGNMYGILAAIFIATAFYGMERRRFQIVLGLAALVIAPVVFGLASGSDGLIYSLVGAFAALFLTLPLSILGFVSREDIIVSMALGGILGAVQYAIAFCIATAFLSIQRMFKVESSASAAVAASAAGPCGTRLLAFDEQSALVEIEMLKMLRMDQMGSSMPASEEERPVECAEREGSGRRDVVLPWCATLAIATLAILMIGTSI